MPHHYRSSPFFEVCVEGLDGLLAAQEGGAGRIELCASLLEGGLTPSLGTVRLALEMASVPVHVMVRPRGGDFLYSETEYRSMLLDVEALRELGAAGVVIGCLSADGRIDEQRMGRLVGQAGAMNVTCHRAFDMTRDPAEALEALVRCGVGRVLTSGQRDSGLDGADLLARLVEQARDRIVVMGCGGLDAGSIKSFLERAGVAEAHFAALKDIPSSMAWRNPHVGMGGTEHDREYRCTVTDGKAVAAVIQAGST